jgi:flagellar biosynthetic protein FliQ
MNHDLAQAFFRATLLVATPVLLSSLIAGLVVGLLQAATQVNEASLSYVVKVVVVGLTLVLVGPALSAELIRYTKACLSDIGQVVH